MPGQRRSPGITCAGVHFREELRSNPCTVHGAWGKVHEKLCRSEYSGVTKILISSRVRMRQNACTLNPDPTLTLFYQPGPLRIGHRAPGPFAQASTIGEVGGGWRSAPLAARFDTQVLLRGAAPQHMYRHTLQQRHALPGRGPQHALPGGTGQMLQQSCRGRRLARRGTRRYALHAQACKGTPGERSSGGSGATRHCNTCVSARVVAERRKRAPSYHPSLVSFQVEACG